MNPEIQQVLSGERQWCVVEGDSLAILPTLPEKAVDHVICDPPYSDDVHSKEWVSSALTAKGDKRASSKHKGIDFASLKATDYEAIAKATALAKRWHLVFCDLESISLWKCAAEASLKDWVRACIWDKVDSSPQFSGDRPAASAEAICVWHSKGRKRWNGGGRRSVFTHAVNRERGHKDHPTQKPIALMLELVSLFTDADDLILDPFGGSGTTGVAAIQLGRRAILIERDPKYAALCRERLQAAESGLTLNAARAGQISLFGAAQ